jgi:hypothetical protein
MLGDHVGFLAGIPGQVEELELRHRGVCERLLDDEIARGLRIVAD